MIDEKRNMSITVTGTEDEKETYEICRTLSENGGKAIVIELYPTISVKEPFSMDVSTLHLLNHAEELGWGEIRIINLYPRVFKSKPTVAQLTESNENFEYIKDMLKGADIPDYDIVIAWGSGLASHACTNHIKQEVLGLLIQNGLESQVKHIVTEALDTNKQLGTHPLFLGLRYSSDRWYLNQYPVAQVLNSMKPETGPTNDKEERKEKRKKGKENVLSNKEQA